MSERVATVRQPDPLEKLGDAPLTVGDRHAPERQGKGDGIGHAQVRGEGPAVVLLDEADAIAPVPLELAVARIGQILPQDDEPSGRGSVQAADEPEKGRLPRARRADDRRHLASPDRDVEPAQRGDLPTGRPVDTDEPRADDGVSHRPVRFGREGARGPAGATATLLAERRPAVGPCR